MDAAMTASPQFLFLKTNRQANKSTAYRCHCLCVIATKKILLPLNRKTKNTDIAKKTIHYYFFIAKKETIKISVPPPLSLQQQQQPGTDSLLRKL